MTDKLVEKVAVEIGRHLTLEQQSRMGFARVIARQIIPIIRKAVEEERLDSPELRDEIEGVIGSDDFVRLNIKVGDYISVTDIPEIAKQILALLKGEN